MKDDDDNRVCIVGLGYVGLTLAVSLADVGFRVHGVERDAGQVQALLGGEGRLRVHEPGIRERIDRALRSGDLTVSDRLADADGCGVYVVCVGTPIDDHGNASLDGLRTTVEAVGRHMAPGALLVLRSTVKLGTTRALVEPLLAATGKPFDLTFCPERTLEGRALEELRTLPQIVAGLGPAAINRAARLFSRLTPSIVHVSSVEVAEVIKLVDNTYRDITFAVANEIALACDMAGVDAIETIRAGALGYPRTSLPVPGPVGGPCLSKDPHILVEGFDGLGAPAEFARLARQTNEALPGRIADRIAGWAEGTGLPAAPRIAILGLAFKGVPETNDLRGTTAVPIRDALLARFPDAEMVGWDPVVDAGAAGEIGFRTEPSAEAALAGCGICILANNHPALAGLPLDRLSNAMARPGLIFDYWARHDARTLRLADGVAYTALGAAARSAGSGAS